MVEIGMRISNNESNDDLRAGQEMILTIFRKKFKENPWFGLYYMDEWNMTPDKVPGLGELLDSYKTPILTGLLKSMREGTPEAQEGVRLNLDRLRKLGAEWPEIDVIDRSLAADKTLKISESSPSADMMQGIIVQLIKDVTDKWYHSDQIEQALDENKRWILEELENNIKDGWPRSKATSVLRTLRQMGALAYYGKYWPELKRLLDDREIKSFVIKSLLSMLKSSTWDVKDLGEFIGYLRAIHIDWPELDVIEKSIRSEVKENDAERLGDWPASAVMDKIRAGHRMALMNGVHDLRYDGVKDNIIVGALKPHDEEIAQWADQMLSAHPNHKELLFSIMRLFEMGGRFPKVAAAMTNHKAPFIKYLLMQFKDVLDKPYVSVSLSKLAERIDLLRAGGIMWPELDAITKSIEARRDEPRRIAEDNRPFSAKVEKLRQKMANNLKTSRNYYGAGLWNLNDAGDLDPAMRKRFLAGMHDEIMAFLDRADPMSCVIAISMLREYSPDWGNLEAVLAKRADDIAAVIESASKSFLDIVSYPSAMKILLSVPGMKDKIRSALVKSLRTAIRDHDLDAVMTSRVIEGFRLMGAKVSVKKTDKILGDIFDAIDRSMAKDGMDKDTLYKINVVTKLVPEPVHAEMRDLIEKNKISIIRNMLTTIKNSDDLSSITLALEDLRKYQIKWPELSVIGKSMRSNMSEASYGDDDDEDVLARIEEALDEEDVIEALNIIDDHGLTLQNEMRLRSLLPALMDQVAYEVVDAAVKGDSEAFIMERIRGYVNDMGVRIPNDRIVKIILRRRDIIKNALVEKVESLSKREDATEELIELINELAHWGIDMSDYIPRDKTVILRMLLTFMKEGHGQAALDYMDKLEHMGVSFPEYEIIKRSANAKGLEEAEGKTDPTVLQAYFRLEDMLENEDFEYLAYWLAKYASHPDKVRFSPFSINDYKTEILRDILYSIKNIDTDDEINMNEEDLPLMVAGARKLGAKWPELDVIERSIKHGIDETSSADPIEDNDAQIHRYSFSRFMQELEVEDSKDLAYYLTRIGRTDLPTPITKDNVTMRLDPYKEKIMHAVLSAIKHADQEEFDDDDIDNMLHALRKMHVEWPELDVIKRSLQADTSK
jgi:hypothetical protein